MFTLLKSTPKLLGAKVEIKFLYFDINKSEIETAVYDQAVIENFVLSKKDIQMSTGSLNQLRLPGKTLLSVLEHSVKVKIKVHLMMMTMMIGKYQLLPQQSKDFQLD